jgi:hypothetical protein
LQRVSIACANNPFYLLPAELCKDSAFHDKSDFGAKSKAEMIADILAAIKERRG